MLCPNGLSTKNYSNEQAIFRFAVHNFFTTFADTVLSCTDKTKNFNLSATHI
jgi:hypothetical protein